jgi:hypothetical protein
MPAFTTCVRLRVRPCLCVCIRVCACASVCACMGVRAYVHACVHMCTRACICARVRAGGRAWVRTCGDAWMCGALSDACRAPDLAALSQTHTQTQKQTLVRTWPVSLSLIPLSPTNTNKDVDLVAFLADALAPRLAEGREEVVKAVVALVRPVVLHPCSFAPVRTYASVRVCERSARTCVCACACVCMRVVCARAYVCVCVCARARACVWAYMCAYEHVHTSTCIPMVAAARSCGAQTRTHKHTHKHTSTSTHKHTHTHARARTHTHGLGSMASEHEETGTKKKVVLAEGEPLTARQEGDMRAADAGLGDDGLQRPPQPCPCASALCVPRAPAGKGARQRQESTSKATHAAAVRCMQAPHAPHMRPHMRQHMRPLSSAHAPPEHAAARARPWLPRETDAKGGRETGVARGCRV